MRMRLERKTLREIRFPMIPLMMTKGVTYAYRSRPRSKMLASGEPPLKTEAEELLCPPDSAVPVEPAGGHVMLALRLLFPRISQMPLSSWFVLKHDGPFSQNTRGIAMPDHNACCSFWMGIQ